MERRRTISIASFSRNSCLSIHFFLPHTLIDIVYLLPQHERTTQRCTYTWSSYSPRLLTLFHQKTAENCTLYFSWKTPMEKIDELEKCINDWLSVEENRWYQPSTSIVLQAINNQNYLEVSIVIPHNRSVITEQHCLSSLTHFSQQLAGLGTAQSTEEHILCSSDLLLPSARNHIRRLAHAACLGWHGRGDGPA